MYLPRLLSAILLLIAIPALATSHNPAKLVKSLEKDPEGGKKVYQQFCQVCHAPNPQIKLGAPTFRNEKAWRVRKRKGIQGLFYVTANGLRAMPPRGGCFECSDELLKKAIRYMLPKETKTS